MVLADFVVAARCGDVRECQYGGGRREDLAVRTGPCWARGCDQIGLSRTDVFSYHGVLGRRG